MTTTAEPINRPKKTTPADHYSEVTQNLRSIDKQMSMLDRRTDRLSSTFEEIVDGLAHGIKSVDNINKSTDNINQLFHYLRQMQENIETLKKLMAKHADYQDVVGIDIEDTIHEDYLVCLLDGKKTKLLTRHLKTLFDMTPDEYRARFNLPPDYPMTAPSTKRKHAAKLQRIKPWLGRKGKGKTNNKKSTAALNT